MASREVFDARFEIVCRKLTDALDKHDEHIQNETRRIQEQIDKAQSLQDLASCSLVELKAIHDAKTRECNALDTVDHERIPTEALTGLYSFKRDSGVTKSSSSKTFSVTSKFPIYSHKRAASRDVEWKDEKWTWGSKSYTAKVKPRRFREAEAEVHFFGRRDEIHAEEIKALCEDLAKNFEDQVRHRQTLKKCDTDIDLYKAAIAGFAADTERSRNDRTLISLAVPSQCFEKPGQPLMINIACISGFARVLGLKTQTQLTPATTEGKAAILEVLRMIKEQTDASKRLYESYGAKWKEMSSSDDPGKLVESKGRIRTILSRNPAFESSAPKLPSTSANKDEKELYDEVRKDLEGCETTLKSAIAESQGELAELVGLTVQASAALGEAPEVRRQATLIDELVEQISSTRRPIGVVAALLATECYANHVEAIFAMYRGEQIAIQAGMRDDTGDW